MSEGFLSIVILAACGKVNHSERYRRGLLIGELARQTPTLGQSSTSIHTLPAHMSTGTVKGGELMRVGGT